MVFSVMGMLLDEDASADLQYALVITRALGQNIKKYIVFEPRLPSMKNALIIDGRNIYDAKELAEAGFEYSAIGC